VTERQHREALVEFSHRLHASGWAANHDGNISVRMAAGRILATPGATSKARVTLDSVLVLDDGGNLISGRGKAFSEFGLHLTAYTRRSDIRAVVHAHPPHATALACAGSDLLSKPFMPEAVVSLGSAIPLVPFAAPGRDACAALSHFVEAHDAVLLSNHGVLTVGTDLEQAYLRMELVEHLARIALQALPIGGVRPLPEQVVETLLVARRKAGLGAPASTEAARPTSVIACAPSPDASVPTRAIGSAAASAGLADIIREELARALRER
jgi:L-fuculose-phosphate aldolase